MTRDARRVVALAEHVVREVEAREAAVERDELAEDAADGDLSTYFASQGTGIELAMDLGRVLPVKGMDIVWYRSNGRKAIFKIDVSVDGKNWKQVFDGKSSGDTPQDKPEFFGFDQINVRYVRITSNGNTQNNWNSICEAMVVLGD